MWPPAFSLSWVPCHSVNPQANARAEGTTSDLAHLPGGKKRTILGVDTRALATLQTILGLMGLGPVLVSLFGLVAYFRL